MECPDCKKVVQVGTAGPKNLEAHRGSKACRRRANGAGSNKPETRNQVLDKFLKPRAPLNPSTVSAPPPICSGKGKPVILAPEHRRPASPMAESPKEPSMPATTHRDQPTQEPTQHVLDERAVRLLQDLEAAVKRIPDNTPIATPEHRLSGFAIDPLTCVAEPGEDDWLILNGMMKSSFGWGVKEMDAAVPHMLNRGTHGLDGFLHFMTFFVYKRGLQGALFETKVEAILKEIEDW